MTNLQGLYDLHVHASPDVVERKFTDVELAQRMVKAGFTGMGLKCHFAETAARAATLRELFPSFNVVGGVTLNRSLGGFNPHAVETCGKMGGTFVWMPTLEARSYKYFHNPQLSEAEASKFLYALDEDGKLLSSIHEVLEVAAQYKMVVCTGHLSAKEGLAVLQAAKEHGVEKMVATHADNPADAYTTEEQLACVKLGAMIEHCYFTVFKKRTPLSVVVEQMEVVGFEHTFISTDFGQVDNLFPDEGIAEFIEALAKEGISAESIEKMAKINPQRLINK